MSFEDHVKDYESIPQAERVEYLLALFAEKRYNPVITASIAKENPDLISDILLPMYGQASRYLAMELLKRVADTQGLDTVVRILGQSGLMSELRLPALAEIDLYICDDNNPLHALYHHLGPRFFVALHEEGLADVRTLYLWVRAETKPDHRNFLTALVREHAHDVVNCPELLRDGLLVEHEIATAKGARWHLKQEAEFLLQLLDASSEECFEIGLDLISAKLMRFDPLSEAENLVYLHFLRHFAYRHYGEREAAAIERRYWLWLTSCPRVFHGLHELFTTP